MVVNFFVNKYWTFLLASRMTGTECAGGCPRASNTAARWWLVAVAFFCLVGLVLRLRGINDPLLDHPGWRQGDTAAIARNFATLNYNIFFPQTEYNGPAPNYVELELQIVPFLAATLYKLFGIHEVFGRLIAIGFGVATIAVVGAFARWLFASSAAGIAALALYAIFPGSVYYARTFQPDVAMVFFLTAGLYAFARWTVEADGRSRRGAATVCVLLALAFLAKAGRAAGADPRGRARRPRFGGARGALNGRSFPSCWCSRSSRWRSTNRMSQPTPSGIGRAGSCSCTFCRSSRPA